MGVSNKLETAIGMAGATTFVLTLAAMSSYMVNSWLLEPLGARVPKNHLIYFGDCRRRAIHPHVYRKNQALVAIPGARCIPTADYHQLCGIGCGACKTPPKRTA